MTVIEARISALEELANEFQGSKEETGESGEQGIGEEEETEQEKVKIEKWVAWDGISNRYQYGAVVKHKGKYYQNMLQNVQNVWEPGSVGVDERYWKEITKEEAEVIVKGETEVIEPGEGEQQTEGDTGM